MKFCRLDFLDGDFTLIFPPTIAQSAIVVAHLEEFKQAIAGQIVWPPQTDAVFYTLNKRYYEKLGNLVGVDCDRLTAESRHRFFVATEPIEIRGQWVPGLSDIEKLMGCSYQQEESNAEERLSTGNPLLDISTHALLIFKIPGLEQVYSPNDLRKMCQLAGDLMQAAEEKAKKKEKYKSALSHQEVRSELPTDDWWELRKISILKGLKALEVTIPEGF